MNERFEQFSQGIDFFRNLGTVVLSGSQELMSWQLDRTQAFIELSGQQLRTVWSDASAAQEPDQWLAAVQAGMRDAIQMTRDSVLAASDYQMESLQLLQKQAAEARKILADSLNEQSRKVKLVRAGDKPRTASSYSHKNAA